MPLDLSAAAGVPSVVLCTLNAKYIHASLGLRYLLANMGDLKPCTVLREFTIARRPQEVLDELLALLGPQQPGATQVVGFGVYIWNVTQTEALLRLLKAQRPDIKVVAGGVIPPQDYDYLRESGVQGIYGPGSNVVECAADMLRLLGHNMPPLDA